MDELTEMLFPDPAPFILLAVSVTSILTLVVLTNRLLTVKHDIEKKKKRYLSRHKLERLEDVYGYIGHLARLIAGHLVLFFMVILRIILDIESLSFDRSIAIFLAVLVLYWIFIFLLYYTDWLRRFKCRDWKFRLKRRD